ncbi:ABC transporter ATP-binding protein [Microbacterium gorillae]|uniref:ABC transporter ATP-binding protein n=1 Tax=Microbacterium gorillae TaxID=1231063 RepID=UPI003D95585B
MWGLFSPHRQLIILLILLTSLSAVLGLGPPLLIREIINKAIPDADLPLLTVLTASMVGIAALLQATSLAQTVLSARIGERVVGKLRAQLFSHVQRLELAYFMRRGESTLRARLSSDVAGMRTLVTTTGVAIVTNVAVTVATIVAMLVMSWQLAIGSIIAIALAIWVARSTGRRRQDVQYRVQELNEDIDRQVAEALSADGMLLNRATGMSSEIDKRFTSTADALTTAESRLQLVGGGRLALISLAFAALPAGIYWFGGYLNITDEASLGTLVAFASLQFSVMRPAMGVLNISTQIITSRALFSRVFELLALPTESERTLVLTNTEVTSLTITNVSYAYQQDREILTNVSLTAKRGDFVSIVGPSGVGKSTLAKLCAGLLAPSSGSASVNDTELSELTYESLASCVRLVAQDTFIHDSTLRDNITWGSNTHTVELLDEALEIAQLTEYVASLSDGLDTQVGPRGATMSGGQRQRVAIARAVLANPDILILDESTSALDAETEQRLLAAVKRKFATRIVVLITHRAQAAAHADRTFEVREGTLVAIG